MLTAVSSWLVVNRVAVALQFNYVQLLRMLNVEEVPESFEQGECAAKSLCWPFRAVVGTSGGLAMRADEVPEALREVAVKVSTCVSLALALHQ